MNTITLEAIRHDITNEVRGEFKAIERLIAEQQECSKWACQHHKYNKLQTVIRIENIKKLLLELGIII